MLKNNKIGVLYLIAGFSLIMLLSLLYGFVIDDIILDSAILSAALDVTSDTTADASSSTEDSKDDKEEDKINGPGAIFVAAAIITYFVLAYRKMQGSYKLC